MKVTENTAIILDECNILTTYRGETFVKGAGYIKTYFVPLDENFKLIRKEQSMAYYRTQDRTRYYNVMNAITDSNGESTFHIRDLTEEISDDESHDGKSFGGRTATPTDDNYSIDNDFESSVSESIKDTRC